MGANGQSSKIAIAVIVGFCIVIHFTWKPTIDNTAKPDDSDRMQIKKDFITHISNLKIYLATRFVIVKCVLYLRPKNRVKSLDMV